MVGVLPHQDRVFLPKVQTGNQTPGAADKAYAVDPPLPSTSDSGDAKCLGTPQFHKRALVLVAAACFGAGAAVCSAILRVIPPHRTAAGVGDTPRTWEVAPVTRNAGVATGAGNLEQFPAGHTFVLVPRVRDEPQLAAGGGTDSERWGRRKLASSSTPLSSAVLELGSIGGMDGRGEAMATADVAASDNRVERNDDRGWAGGSRPLFTALFDDLHPDRAETTIRATMTTADGVQHVQVRAKSESGTTAGGGSMSTAAAVGGGSRHGGSSRREGRRDLMDAVSDAVSDDVVKHDFEAIGDDGGGICAPLEVVGLEHCPQLNSVEEAGGMHHGNAFVRKAIAAKADMLRQVVKVLTDPTSAGLGGHPDEPLLLVQKLALDETDAIFGAFESRFLGYAADAGSWSSLPGGFSRWLEKYHRVALLGSRPVLVAVHGDDVCALEKELSLGGRVSAAAEGVTPDGIIGNIAEEPPASAVARNRRQATNERGKGRSSAGEDGARPHLAVEGQKEGFEEVPVVLMTVGWDPAGDPTHSQADLGRDTSCAVRVLEMKRVVKWFTSHTRSDSHSHEKFRYLPIGFGGYETRNGLPQTAYIDAAKRQLEVLETCPIDKAGSYDLLFQGNTLDRDPRTTIWKQMTEGKGSGTPVPVNRAPLEASDMVTATARGIFAISPPGTGPDCFRHYEMMLEGNIALVPDAYSIRSFMDGLPAFFFGGPEEAWGSLTCDRLSEMAETVQAEIKGRPELRFEKLTHGFWRRYVRREILRAARVGVTPEGVADTDPAAAYVERSALPMNPPGWTTFRQVGCFSRGEGHHDDDQRYQPSQQQQQQHQPTRSPHRSTRPFHQISLHEEAENGTTTGGERRPPDSQHRHLLLLPDGPDSVRLDGPERTPEGCAAHCSTSAGGEGVGFFGISSGDGCWCDNVPGRFLPMDRCQIDCDEEGGGRCGGAHASSVYVFGPEDRGAPFEYMGCFPSTDHVMFHAAVHLGKGNTPFMCEALCTSMRYPFFALEKSELCRCGVMPTNTPRSDKVPAYIKEGGYEPPPGPPNATLAAKPVPDGVRVGDPRFECHRRRCGGSSRMWGCGAERAYDLYRNVDPCVLYRDCRH